MVLARWRRCPSPVRASAVSRRIRHNGTKSTIPRLTPQGDGGTRDFSPVAFEGPRIATSIEVERRSRPRPAVHGQSPRFGAASALLPFVRLAAFSEDEGP